MYKGPYDRVHEPTLQQKVNETQIINTTGKSHLSGQLGEHHASQNRTAPNYTKQIGVL